jgi:hypothetical protein
VHGDVNDALQDGKDLVLRLLAFFVLNVLVPKGMRQEIQPNSSGSALEEQEGGILCRRLFQSQTKPRWTE